VRSDALYPGSKHPSERSRLTGGRPDWVFVMKDQLRFGSLSGQRRLSVAAEGYSRTSREQALKTARWEDVEVIEERP